MRGRRLVNVIVVVKFCRLLALELTSLFIFIIIVVTKCWRAVYAKQVMDRISRRLLLDCPPVSLLPNTVYVSCALLITILVISVKR